jgi:hypothetical protein
LQLQKDYVSFTVLCYLKDNEKIFKINSRSRSKLVLNNTLLVVLQLGLVSTLIAEITKDDSGAYDLQTKNFRLFLAKFVASICMHIQIFREFMYG